ncbi:hypothetical protein ABEG17_17740 [Pedococcus sp. KACC 23699]|uniref:BatC protein n=1 Tax=Pedococcus sp. KACC 23699 TaxID=3149228 RepID=A0AAU7JSK1_9MICO
MRNKVTHALDEGRGAGDGPGLGEDAVDDGSGAGAVDEGSGDGPEGDGSGDGVSDGVVMP